MYKSAIPKIPGHAANEAWKRYAAGQPIKNLPHAGDFLLGKLSVKYTTGLTDLQS